MKWRWLISILAVALLFRLAMVAVVRVDKTPSSDEAILVGLAASMADGKGYQLDAGTYWTHQPTLIQSPGWPALLSIPFRALPASWRWPAARVMAIGFDSLAAVLLAVLAARLGAGRKAAAAAGFLYALNPVLAGVAAQLTRESAAVFFMLLFMIAVSGGSPRRVPRFLAAGLCLGYACLIRSNWLLMAPFFAAAFLWFQRAHFLRTLALLAVLAIGVLATQAPWLIRNAHVYRKFPVFGAGGGETLYGGNNDQSAAVGGPYWGYFVFPDKISGETPLRELAGRMSELEVDEYYRARARQWLAANPRKLPGLVLGKLVRAYVPVPRTRGAAVLAGSAYRWLIYALAGAGLWMLWRRRARVGGEALAAIIAVGAAPFATVVVFCGYFRYVLPAELLLLIPAGAWIAARLPEGNAERHQP